MALSNAERQRRFRERKKRRALEGECRGNVVLLDFSLPDWCDPWPFVQYMRMVRDAYIRSNARNAQGGDSGD